MLYAVSACREAIVAGSNAHAQREAGRQCTGLININPLRRKEIVCQLGKGETFPFFICQTFPRMEEAFRFVRGMAPGFEAQEGLPPLFSMPPEQ